MQHEKALACQLSVSHPSEQVVASTAHAGAANIGESFQELATSMPLFVQASRPIGDGVRWRVHYTRVIDEAHNSTQTFALYLFG